MKDINTYGIEASGENYRVFIGPITNPACRVQGWCMYGTYRNCEFDNVCAGNELPTFESAEAELIEIINDAWKEHE